MFTDKKKLKRKNSAPTVKHRGGRDLFWGYFAASGTGCVESVQGRTNLKWPSMNPDLDPISIYTVS